MRGEAGRTPLTTERHANANGNANGNKHGAAILMNEDAEMKIGIKEMVAKADQEITALTVAEVREKIADPNTLLVDLRDIRELTRDGKIPGAFHAPRGMLEFWIDPDSPYHKEEFSSGKTFIFYCSKGWRSALSTQTAQNMGLRPVCHLAGGFEAWKEASGPVETVAKKS